MLLSCNPFGAPARLHLHEPTLLSEQKSCSSLAHVQSPLHRRPLRSSHRLQAAQHSCHKVHCFGQFHTKCRGKARVSIPACKSVAAPGTRLTSQGLARHISQHPQFWRQRRQADSSQVSLQQSLGSSSFRPQQHKNLHGQRSIALQAKQDDDDEEEEEEEDEEPGSDLDGMLCMTTHLVMHVSVFAPCHMAHIEQLHC